MGICASKSTPATEPANGKSNTQIKRQDQSQALASKKNNSPNDSHLSAQQNNSSTDSSNNGEKIPEKSTVQTQNENLAVQNSTVDAAAASQTDKEVKVLLLGSGESGKSTIVKQMKIIHKNGFSKEELFEYKPFVYKNILDCIRNVINAIMELEPDLIKKLTITDADGEETPTNEVSDKIEDADASKSSESGSLQEYQGEKSGRKHIFDLATFNEILDYEFSVSDEDVFDPKIANKIKDIYNTSEVQTFIKFQQGKFYLIDSTHYFLSDLDRIIQPSYIPSQQDILRTRKKTSGIYDFKFQMSSGLNIHMYDVGGQRSERKKWIHCFDNVTLIIFCVALSEYDQVLLEENSQNRLEESLTLFDSVVNSRWFARTSIVLFLNKIDVFADKLPYSPLENFFPDYNGGDNINKAAKYILWRFTQVNRSGLNIYPHVTQATDTSNIQLVFAAVKETILENSLRDSGLL
ncbi:guanine nucleotide binding protein, alpha subunit [Hyphopichia burtonii NRRL Y-1933]|uniref:Guanine nucleotide binding protein, alpha subunit n=1 Tax=Hyphopichia burtonii NRRL Y-1933 TaxID=984485 RepID=A0A1E4RTA3_9ASCO|nr:guanine nucleotide binding protein, alpha subunit [Hyphopichia burtonii NRRL Y-1933]ODV70468.1 guanine nucleotide binding protein, alpha subunit [Hyphopichia burtonii NRRL Y-1933]